MRQSCVIPCVPLHKLYQLSALCQLVTLPKIVLQNRGFAIIAASLVMNLLLVLPLVLFLRSSVTRVGVWGIYKVRRPSLSNSALISRSTISGMSQFEDPTRRGSEMLCGLQFVSEA